MEPLQGSMYPYGIYLGLAGVPIYATSIGPKHLAVDVHGSLGEDFLVEIQPLPQSRAGGFCVCFHRSQQVVLAWRGFDIKGSGLRRISEFGVVGVGRLDCLKNALTTCPTVRNPRYTTLNPEP